MIPLAIFTSGRSVCVHLLGWLAAASVLGLTAVLPTSVSAHDEFKEAMQERYRLRSVSCKACHTDNKDKKIRNAFGKLLFEELKPKELTKNYHEAKSKGDDAKKQFEKKMVKEFLAALKKVEQKAVSFAAVLESGLLNGTRLDKNQVDIDALTITLFSDEQKKAPKGSKKSTIIRGEIKQMPPEEDKPAKQSAPVSPTSKSQPESKASGASSSNQKKLDAGSASPDSTESGGGPSGSANKASDPLGSNAKSNTPAIETPAVPPKPE